MALSILDPPVKDADPLDAQLSDLGAAPPRSDGGTSWFTRFGIAWTSGPSPLTLLLVGVALGPHGAAVLTSAVLSALDPAVPVALAALGVHVGLHADLEFTRDSVRRVAAVSLSAFLLGAIVAGGLLLLLTTQEIGSSHDRWLLALAAGICAAMAPAVPARRAGVQRTGDRLALLLPIVLGGLLLVWVRGGTAGEGAKMFGQILVLPVLIGAAAWLLLAPHTSDTEQRIYTLAALLLIGGVADYLSMSALFSGLVAGVFWRTAGGPAHEAVSRDVGYFRHPLAAFLLIIAGAHMTTSADPSVIVLYPLLAFVGTLAGAAAARRLGGDGARSRLLPESVAPGVFAVAFALSTVRSAGAQMEPLVGVVAIGTMALHLVGAFRAPQERQA